MADFLKGVDFFNRLWNSEIPEICLENSQPHQLAMLHIGRYNQLVQPWMFGDPFTKGAALWLKNLPKLVATHTKADYEQIFDACHKMPPGPDREKERSRTHPSIAETFALHWG